MIAIPSLPSHLDVLRCSIPRVKRLYGKEPLVVTPDPASLQALEDLGVRIVADQEYAGLGKAGVMAMLPESKRGSAGWYYQQLLKYDIVLKSPADQVLVMDADTVLLRAVPASRDDVTVFPRSGEEHVPYFRGFEALTGLPRGLASSAIVNFMWFSRPDLSRLVERIGERCGGDWRGAILRVASRPECSFSEYETYGNWCANQGGRVDQVPLRLFRRGDLLLSGTRDVEAIVRSAERRGFDAVAFERGHRTTALRRVLARALLGVGLCTNGRRYV